MKSHTWFDDAENQCLKENGKKKWWKENFTKETDRKENDTNENDSNENNTKWIDEKKDIRENCSAVSLKVNIMSYSH